MAFYERYIAMCKERDVAPSRVIRDLGYSTSKLDYWKNGSTPKQEVIEKIAGYLHCSPGDFFDDRRSDISDFEQELLDAFREHTKADQYKIMYYVMSLKDIDD